MHPTTTKGAKVDKTNYAQSLMHMIKGNLGTGILAMPAAFAHFGLINAIIILPALCLIATYCVHLLVQSSRRISEDNKSVDNPDYASLAKYSFKFGPRWMRQCSGFMCLMVDGILLLTQIGVCSVYLVFVTDNLTKILTTFNIYIDQSYVFLMILPVALLLSYIRTLRRLAYASAIANVLQVVGLILILQYLIQGVTDVKLEERDNFRPLSEVALGFGSAMFAFEGISVVLPIYNRMKRPLEMQGTFGLVNVSYIALLFLYFAMGLFGYLKFGRLAKDSITLNLPAEPLYEAVRAIFTASVFLTYPLQFLVPNEIIWNWIKKNYLLVPDTTQAARSNDVEVTVTSIQVAEREAAQNSSLMKDAQKKSSWVPDDGSLKSIQDRQRMIDRYDYLCRTVLVVVTFVIAMSIPRLNLLMDLIGSISGTALSITLPAIIHLAAFGDAKEGMSKVAMILTDGTLIIISIVAGAVGATCSLSAIIKSFQLA